MAVSKEFLALFEKFVACYKTSETSYLSYLHLTAVDTNYLKRCNDLDGFNTLIKTDPTKFTEVKVVNAMNAFVAIHADNYLLQCWSSCFREYIQLNNISDLNAGCEEHFFLSMDEALRDSISSSKAVGEAYFTQLEALAKQFCELTDNNDKLTEQNNQLQAELAKLEHLRQLQTQINTLQQQLQSGIQLLATVNTTMQETPAVATASPRATAPVTFAVPPPPPPSATQKSNKLPLAKTDSTSSSSSSDNKPATVKSTAAKPAGQGVFFDTNLAAAISKRRIQMEAATSPTQATSATATDEGKKKQQAPSKF